MRCFHGTTIDNFLNLIDKNKVKGDTEGTWYCSDGDNCLYVYPLNKIKKNECVKNNKEAKERSIQRAIESACITASRFKRNNQIVIIELEIHDDSLEDDYSCPNMSELSSFIPSSDFNINMIKKVYIVDFLGMYIGLYAPVDFHHFNSDDFSEMEKRVILSMRENSCDLSFEIQYQMYEDLKTFTFNQFVKEYKIDKNILKVA